MTTFTDKELIKEIKERIGSLEVRDNIERRAYEIALASLEADPVAYIFKHPAGKLFWALTDESNKEQADVIPVYAAPPVTVVPEEKPMPNPLSMYAVDAVAAIAEVRGWNACRAAMLQGKSEQPQNAQQNIPENIPGGNSPVTPDGWISCSERMPNDKQYVWCWGKSYGWTECDTFEGYYDCSRNKWWAVTDDGEEPASKVTHWIPLPEPPQEVK
ncbi:DUF551 domain-containing protein [Escherichia coli]|nr:DUF551 domain-containing protein [Escherichia coli]EJU9700492.1 DUF551 domain-containing protein [Escherichia coli]